MSVGVVATIPAFFVVYAGLLAADFMLYGVGRKYGRMIVTHKRFRKVLSAERLSQLEKIFDRKGILVILLGRHLIGIRAQIFLTAGAMRMPATSFLAADALSSVLTIAVMVGAGYIGGHSLQIIRNDMARIEHMGVLLLVILFAGYLLLRRLRTGRDNTIR
jgi:membrane protein DedA with SNARE-associated domain